MRTWLEVVVALVLGLVPSVNVFADGKLSCQLYESRDYVITDHAVPISADAYLDANAASSIIREYGVAYRLAGLPQNYAVPTELKTFAMQNHLDGIEIYPGPDYAEYIQSSDGKKILVVTDNIAGNPDEIMKQVIGVTRAEVAQGEELRSVIDVEDRDKAWNAKFAKMISHGVDHVTGKNGPKGFDSDKVKPKQGDFLFAQMFGEDKVTILVRNDGPYEIDVREFEKPVVLQDQTGVQLLFALTFKDPNAPWAKMYVSDLAELYTCEVVY